MRSYCPISGDRLGILKTSDRKDRLIFCARFPEKRSQIYETKEALKILPIENKVLQGCAFDAVMNFYEEELAYEEIIYNNSNMPVNFVVFLKMIIKTIIIVSFIVSILVPKDTDTDTMYFAIKRPNSESNPYGNGTDYFSVTYRRMFCYSLITGEKTVYYTEVPENEYIRRDLAVVDDWIYYTTSDNTVRRFDRTTQKDEEILSTEDIFKLHDEEKLTEYDEIQIKRYKDYLLLQVPLEHNEYAYEYYLYVCPVYGNMKTDCVDVNALFPEENQTGMEEEIVCQGMCIRRYYNADKGRYVIEEVKEEESGRDILWGRSIAIKVNGEMVSLWKKDDKSGFIYCVEGDLEEREIECLENSEYKDSYIIEDKITAEDGKIIGLMHVVKDWRSDPDEPTQRSLKYDILFRLDPQTGESHILYNTQNNCTRIIGYQDGIIYLMRDYKIYTKKIDSNKETLFLELTENCEYIFDWQGDYLVIFRGEPYLVYGYNLFGAYKVK